jgi:hypothetical protein
MPKVTHTVGSRSGVQIQVKIFHTKGSFHSAVKTGEDVHPDLFLWASLNFPLASYTLSALPGLTWLPQV